MCHVSRVPDLSVQKKSKQEKTDLSAVKSVCQSCDVYTKIQQVYDNSGGKLACSEELVIRVPHCTPIRSMRPEKENTQ